MSVIAFHCFKFSEIFILLSSLVLLPTNLRAEPESYKSNFNFELDKLYNHIKTFPPQKYFMFLVQIFIQDV